MFLHLFFFRVRATTNDYFMLARKVNDLFVVMLSWEVGGIEKESCSLCGSMALGIAIAMAIGTCQFWPAFSGQFRRARVERRRVEGKVESTSHTKRQRSIKNKSVAPSV